MDKGCLKQPAEDSKTIRQITITMQQLMLNPIVFTYLRKYAHVHAYTRAIFYRTQVSLGSDLWVRMSVRPSVRPSVTETPFADLTDVTLADEDIKSILTDNVNRAM